MNSKLRMGLGFLLGALFVYAGIMKVLAPARFFEDVQNYDIIPWRWATVILTFYLPWLEIICGMAVIAHPLRFGALVSHRRGPESQSDRECLGGRERFGVGPAQVG
jgi:hypothetical protein